MSKFKHTVSKEIKTQNAEREFEFLIMENSAEATTGEVFVINRIILRNSYESWNV